MYLNCEYTLPAGEPRIKFEIAALACLMLAYDPKNVNKMIKTIFHSPIMCTLESAKTILVLVAFSIAFLVFPFSPLIRAIHLERWSPITLLLTSPIKLENNKQNQKNYVLFYI